MNNSNNTNANTNNVNTTPCTRCGGKRYIEKYKNVKGGICFHCKGTGVEPARPIKKDTPKPRKCILSGPKVERQYKLIGFYSDAHGKRQEAKYAKDVAWFQGNISDIIDYEVQVFGFESGNVGIKTPKGYISTKYDKATNCWWASAHGIKIRITRKKIVASLTFWAPRAKNEAKQSAVSM